MLKVFLDTESLDKISGEDTDLNDLLYYDQEPFEFLRTDIDVINKKLEDIARIERIELSEKQSDTMSNIFEKLKFHPKNDGQRQFLYAMQRYATQSSNANYVHDAIFVTENEFLLTKYVPGGEKRFSLKDLFPNLILVNPNMAMEVMKIYATKLGYLQLEENQGFEKDESKKFAWYFLQFFSTFPNLSNYFKKIETSNGDLKFLNSLNWRLLKIFICLDYLGDTHYFMSRKGNPIDPNKLKEGIEELKKQDPMALLKLAGLVDPYDQWILFYHLENYISVVTGIYDNLALITSALLGLKLPPMRISLSKDSGDELVKEIGKINLNLRNFICKNRNLIELIYQFRESVVHREGMNRRAIPLSPNWSNFVQIDESIRHQIKQVGDRNSEYKYITCFGVIVLRGQLYMDPYYFAVEYFKRLTAFVENYVNYL